MCGIVAYIGHREACPIILKGLRRLEYRGYDSAGIALANNGLNVYKKKGKVSELEKFLEDKDISGKVGMGHTRWATHGEPNDRNAHPHYSNSKGIAIIHNGTILFMGTPAQVKANADPLIQQFITADFSKQPLTV